MLAKRMHDVIENFTADGARDSQLIWRAWRNTYPTLIIAAALYKALARSGTFPQALTPTLGAIAHTLVCVARRRHHASPCGRHALSRIGRLWLCLALHHCRTSPIFPALLDRGDRRRNV